MMQSLRIEVCRYLSTSVAYLSPVMRPGILKSVCLSVFLPLFTCPPPLPPSLYLLPPPAPPPPPLSLSSSHMYLQDTPKVLSHSLHCTAVAVNSTEGDGEDGK